MIDALLAAMPLLKALHLTALCLWCGSLAAMPLMLTRHDPAITQRNYHSLRRATHLTYTRCVTPAGVIAVISGTWLIFLREAFVPWLYAKLLFVTVLVVVHIWIGHVLVRVAEKPEQHRPPHPLLGVTAVLLPVLAILLLVLGKPELDWLAFPDWLLEPRGGQLPFEVPRR